MIAMDRGPLIDEQKCLVLSNKTGMEVKEGRLVYMYTSQELNLASMPSSHLSTFRMTKTEQPS
jgi:hypothetical protein